MAIFKFTRHRVPATPPRHTRPFDAAIEAQRARLLEANAMTVSALAALGANSDPDAGIRHTLNAVRELICGAALALDPVRLRDSSL